MPNVLIVEPDADFAGILKRALEEFCSPRTALDAQSAVSEADKQTPDLISLELAIPEHNGVEFLNELRSYSDWIGVPVIVYSRVAMEDTGLSDERWAEYGVRQYLYKPTSTLADYQKAVKRILNS